MRLVSMLWLLVVRREGTILFPFLRLALLICYGGLILYKDFIDAFSALAFEGLLALPFG